MLTSQLWESKPWHSFLLAIHALNPWDLVFKWTTGCVETECRATSDVFWEMIFESLLVWCSASSLGCGCNELSRCSMLTALVRASHHFRATGDRIWYRFNMFQHISTFAQLENSPGVGSYKPFPSACFELSYSVHFSSPITHWNDGDIAQKASGSCFFFFLLHPLRWNMNSLRIPKVHA